MARPPRVPPGATGGQPPRAPTVRVRSSATRSASSRRWLDRQLNDPYVRAAVAAGWRSRAAFKLAELDDRYHLIRPGMRVIDLGCAPGGWTQVALKRGAGCVVGVDLLEVPRIEGATLLQGDFNDPGIELLLMQALGAAPDLVLSDMAPNTTGHAATDHLRIIGLAELALDFAVRHLATGGSFIAKVFQGGTERVLLDAMKQRFTQVRHAKPPASRKDSSELYVVASGLRR